MDNTLHKDRGDGKPSWDKGRGRRVRKKNGRGKGIGVCSKLGIRKRRILHTVKNLAEIEISCCAVYIAVVAISMMVRELVASIPRITAGGCLVAAGLAVWLAADRLEKHLGKRIKK